MNGAESNRYKAAKDLGEANGHGLNCPIVNNTSLGNPMEIQKLDVYVPDNASAAICDALKRAEQEISLEIKIIGTGYALNYKNVFGIATPNAIARLKQIKEIFVNELPPELEADD